MLSTIITQEKLVLNPIVKSDEGSKIIPQASAIISKDEPHLFSIGIAIRMIGADEKHALRKVGHALINANTDFKSSVGPTLSEDATIVIEEIAFPTGIAKPRDTNYEVNAAKFVSGGMVSPK